MRLICCISMARICVKRDADKDGKVTPEEMQMFFRGGSPTSDQ
jgi:hypothetical protein